MTMLFLFAALFALLGGALLYADYARKNAPSATPQPAQSEPHYDYIEGDDLTLERAQPEETPSAAVKEKATAGGFRTKLLSTGKKERKTWAQHHGYEFTKQDPFLEDEWTRGAAASGGVIRDIISTNMADHEFYFVDIAGVLVMAMRRSASSEVVICAQKPDIEFRDACTDLTPLSDVHGFSFASSNQGATERMMDSRIVHACQHMPDAVQALWWENDWVLAQLERTATAQDWDETIPQLQLLADAALVLPAKSGAFPAINFAEHTPTRPLPAPPLSAEGDDYTEEELPELLRIVAQDEPVTLPKRAKAQNRGVMELREVGADEVQAIAHGKNSQDRDTRQGTKILRKQVGDSHIFHDASPEE
ncbi:hypothetical protein FQV43_00785 [Corynebacterium sp. sy039]|nr:hypothetical protein FQV43_00785 [Corynebacterium sp. sy039]